METIVHELVPIFGIFMIIAIVIGPMWVKSYYAAQDRARLHETLRIAYDAPLSSNFRYRLSLPVTRAQQPFVLRVRQHGIFSSPRASAPRANEQA